VNSPKIFLGIDVQLRRRCPFYAIAPDGALIDSGWLPAAELAPSALRTLALRLADGDLRRIAIGIDAPRLPLPSPRRWSWNGARSEWTPAANAKTPTRGAGRHCEVVVKALGLANPQWTPVAGPETPDWMQLGFDLFAAVADAPFLYEVFPSAAYTQLSAANPPGHPAAYPTAITVNFAHFAPGPKDMLDAALGALVVRDFSHGLGDALGGGDGLGTIIVPRTIGPKESALHRWPDSNVARTR
jgi:hypothetical protein